MQVARDRTGLVADALLQVSVAAKAVNFMIDDGVLGFV